MQPVDGISGAGMGEQINRWFKPIIVLLCGFACTALAAEQPQQNDWVQSGWQELEIQHPQQALLRWQQGVNNQADSRLFAVLGVYQQAENAWQQLHQIGSAQQTFIIHVRQRYYLLSARDVALAWPLRQQQLADLKEAAGITATLLATSAKSLKHDTRITDEAVPEAASPPVSTSAPDWLIRGWQQLDSYDVDQALQTWQIGLNDLPDNRLLVSLGVFAKQENAVAKIKQIGRRQQLLIAIRHIGKPLYYVLSMRDVPTDTESRQASLADLKKAAHINSRLLALASVNFKNRLIPEHYPEVLTSEPTTRIATPDKRHEDSQPSTEKPLTTENYPPINRVEVTGNQQVSTDTIILELRDFFDMRNSPANQTLIKRRVSDLYHDTGLHHARIDIPAGILDDTVRISIHEDARQ